MIGKKINRWTIKEFRGTNKHRQKQYLCECECGTERLIPKTILNRIPSNSCGCTMGIHKQHGTKTYHSWQSMIRRCVDPKHKGYKNYGGRGITVCDRWRNSFKYFLEDVGKRPDGHTLDRIDVDGDYEPSNCRWADGTTQALNKRVRISGSGEKNITMRKFKNKTVYKATLKRNYIERCSLCYEDISIAKKIRDEWLEEYNMDRDKWITNTKNKKYRK